MTPQSADSRSITAFGSSGVEMVRCLRSDGVSVHYATFSAGGRLGRHPATRRQSFTVVAGTGWVAGTDSERQAIAAGQTVIWEQGEEHESGSNSGMSAVIVEES